MRFFNTEGPVRVEDHYAIPPLKRGNVDEILQLIRAKRYFGLHAPPQTGKTSALIALRDLLNSGQGGGDFRCVDVNVEVGQVARDIQEGMHAILSSLAMSAEFWAMTMWRTCGRTLHPTLFFVTAGNIAAWKEGIHRPN